MTLAQQTARTRIVVVEDERIVALNLQQRLTKLGYDVPAVAASGAAALAMISELHPDIVLMDIHIEGDIDGIETASRIPPEPLIPVIYLTAHSEDATVDRAAATKPFGYLIKPFSERELHTTVQMVLQRRATEVALRRSEQELRQSQDSFRYLFRNNPLPMWVVDIETLRFLEVNEAAVINYGFTRDEFLAMQVTDIHSPENVARLLTFFRTEAPAYGHVTNWQHRRKSGKMIEVDVFSHALSFEGRPSRLGVAVDVTERNAAEEKLRQAQKLEAIGELTGGIAHDFNNLLAIILGNTELVKPRVTGDLPASEMVADVLKAAGRGASLTRRLLAYSRQQPLEPRVLALDKVVADLTKLLRRTLGEIIDVQASVPMDLWSVLIDPNELEHALLNLAVNARDAMPEGGRLTIEGFNTTLDEEYCATHAEAVAGPYVLLAVSDTGTGMSKQVIERAFEPFFTTKPFGRGTGLGLSMVYGFIKQSGGHVTIYSEPGRGTTIKLYLLKADGALSPAVVDVPPLKTTGSEVILVVEDDAAVRRLAVRLLTGLGYRTVEAGDGPAALQALEQAGSVALLFTDVILPKGMNGAVLAREAQRRQPDLKVLYMSGYTKNAILHNGVLDEGVSLLMKPFNLSDLALKVRQALEDRGAV